MLTTSETLLQRLRHPHDEAAWARFVDLYTPVLFAWARQLGLQDADAADLVQEVFSLVVNKLPSFVYDRSKSFRGWLRTVAVNQWRESQRRRAKEPSREVIDLERLTAPAAEAFWEEEYRGHLVRRALALMQSDFEPATWKACWECVVNSRAAPDVAMDLGMTPSAVRAAKFRVLNRLRQELAGFLD